MARSLAINVDALSPKQALVRSLTDLSPVTALQYTLGDQLTHDLFLVNENGAYDSHSGDATYSVRVGVGAAGGVPSAGTYKLNWNGHDTTALAYNSTAQQVQDALNVALIGNGLIVVRGTFPTYFVEFTGALAGIDQPLINVSPSASATSLYPLSTVNVNTVQTGSMVGGGAVTAIQCVQIELQPVMLQTSWSPKTQSVANGNPTGGTFTLSFGGQTTGALAYNASVSTVQTALTGLSSIGSGNCTVSGVFPNYVVTFTGALAGIPVALITANAASLTPASQITIAMFQVGGGANNAIQTINLEAVTTSNIGWTARLEFTSDTLIALFSVSGGVPQKQITQTLEIEIIDASGKVVTQASPDITLYHRVLDADVISEGPRNVGMRGKYDIPSGTDYVTITGLGLSAAPRIITLTVAQPAGGLVLFASPVISTYTTAGFSASLSGVTDVATYDLYYDITY